MSQRLALALRLFFWAAMLFAFVMAILPKPPAFPGVQSDKVQHIIAFLTLTTLALLAYPRARRWLVFAGMVTFGALIEFVQAIPMLHRDASFWDWLADTGAVAVILVLAWIGQQLVERARQ